MLLPIVQFDDPRLRTRSREITFEELASPRIQKLIDDMAQTMDAAQGVGIAAPQVGENLRIFWVSYRHWRFPVINPVVEFLTDRTKKLEEGCLSYPKIFGVVERKLKLKLTGLDRFGKPLEYVFRDYIARVVQHETDHLDGKVIVDKFTHIV